jgi:hypothetical protein
MTDDEAAAYKLGLYWLEAIDKTFPDYRHNNKYPKKGDPRKSNLFRHCYKLNRELKGILKAEEHKYYVIAQLQMLKSIEINNLHPNITPWCLTGPKAWTRWKMWKKKFDNIEKVKTAKDVAVDKVENEEIKKAIEKSEAFLIKKLGSLTEENFQARAKDIERWIAQGLISGFYAVTSPWVSKYCQLNIDLSYFKENIK